MPTELVPYPSASPGVQNDIDQSLQEGRLSPIAANSLLAEGVPWALAARHVTDRAWWQAQRRRPASRLRHPWRITSWDATLHIETDEVSIWVDPGPEEFNVPNREPDLVLVTHAHLDHIARLGDLVARWPGTTIVMTAETAQLLVARDQDGSLRRALQRTALLAFGAPRQLNGVGVRLIPAGHVLGAAMLDLEVAGDRVLITGDFALRDVGGLRGADLPTGDYGLVLMESTQADWRTLPVADERTTRQPLLHQLAQLWSTDYPTVIQANSLGQIQEVYAAVVMAQRAGAWPEAQYRMQVAGAAADACRQYYDALAEHSPVWRFLPEISSYKEITAGVLLLTSASQPSLGNEPGAAIGGHPIHVLQQPEIYTHAGWAERLTLAFGTACGQIGFYHGSTPDLRLFLAECGFSVIPHFSEGMSWTNRP